MVYGESRESEVVGATAACVSLSVRDFAAAPGVRLVDPGFGTLVVVVRRIAWVSACMGERVRV